MCPLASVIVTLYDPNLFHGWNILETRAFQDRRLQKCCVYKPICVCRALLLVNFAYHAFVNSTYIGVRSSFSCECSNLSPTCFVHFPLQTLAKINNGQQVNRSTRSIFHDMSSLVNTVTFVEAGKQSSANLQLIQSKCVHLKSRLADMMKILQDSKVSFEYVASYCGL